MRKTFAPMDDALIERLFQPASDYLVYRTGATGVQVACLFTDLASLFWIASRIRGLSNAVLAWEATDAFLDLAFLLLGLIALISLRKLFRMAKGKQCNPLRIAMQPYRAIVLMMLAARLLQLRAPGLTDAADVAMLVFATSALYLGACVKRPPVQRPVANALPVS